MRIKWHLVHLLPVKPTDEKQNVLTQVPRKPVVTDILGEKLVELSVWKHFCYPKQPGQSLKQNMAFALETT